MTACIRSVATLGSESAVVEGRPKTRGTTGQANELQLLVNQVARATTGCFRTTNPEALSMESGLGPAAALAGEQTVTFRTMITQPTAW